MDTRKVGRTLRAIRLRANRRQQDVALAAKVPRWSYLRAEAGDLSHLSVPELAAVCAALEANLEVTVRWNGTDLDRLLAAGHSALHEAVARRLVALGWEIAPEVTFSWFGERGVIDILAWHAATGTLLVIELKTEIVDIQQLISRVDVYRRHATRLAADRGWEPVAIAVWVAVLDTPTNRRRFRQHRTVLRAAFPMEGRALAPWLGHPSGAVKALSFLDEPVAEQRTAARGSRKRVVARTRRLPAHMSLGTALRKKPDGPVGPSDQHSGEERLVSLALLADLEG